jgi:hypothetical protein
MEVTEEKMHEASSRYFSGPAASNESDIENKHINRFESGG